MKTEGYDNIEVAREMLNIMDWVLECYQFEEKQKKTKDSLFTFDYILPENNKNNKKGKK